MEELKSKTREIIYLITDLNQTLRELMESIRELEIEIDYELNQKHIEKKEEV